MKIKSIKKIGVNKVYDMTVEKNHNFIVNDVVAHNCVNFRIAQYLNDNIKSSRILIHDSLNREEVLKFHKTSKNPTVLLSPSMTEGIDLADDAGRFQIMCKVPFPYLGDKVILKRMEKDKDWYDYQTVKTVVQAFGRSVRHEDDYAISYILDRDWQYFFKRTYNMFPEELKCID